MNVLEMFEKMIDREVAILGDDRFVFDYAILESLNTAEFHFKFGTLRESFSLGLGFLNLDDESIMRLNAAKLVEKAYIYLMYKTQNNYSRILENLVEVIKDIVKKSPINDFEVSDVDYRFTTASVNFEIFGYSESLEVNLESMESFGGAEKYAKYVIGRVIRDAAETMMDDAKKGL